MNFCRWFHTDFLASRGATSSMQSMMWDFHSVLRPDTTGIMWTGEEGPASRTEWIYRESDSQMEDGFSLGENISLIRLAGSRVPGGIDKLNRFLPHITGGFDAANAWSLGGHFQMWQALVAQAIVQKAGGNGADNAEEWIAQIRRLKRAYKQWAEEWMTPRSADQNSGLIYDAIAGYFQE